jgi:uncharacterized protein YecT (DUF1311 family)
MTINRRIKVSSLLRLAAFCITIGIATGLFAQDSAAATEQDCQQATVQSAMRSCENARYEVAQRELNSAYQSLLHHLDDARRLKLRQSQRAWVRFRDANATFRASLVDGGTLAPLIKVATLTEMTNARTADLKKALPH